MNRNTDSKRLSGREEGVKRLGDWPGKFFEHSPVAYCLIDLNGVLIAVNQAAARLFGHSREELRGKKLTELNILTSNQFAKLESSINNWKKGKPSGPTEYILNRKDGSQVFVESWSFPVKSGDQNLALTMVIDLTDRVRAEEALKKSEKSTGHWLSISRKKYLLRMGAQSIYLAMKTTPET